VSGTVIEIDGGAALTDAPSVLLARDGDNGHG
jgi:hypothetical protein